MTEEPASGFVPYLSVHNAQAAIDFYSQVFGIEPRLCLKLPDGRIMHCEFRIGATRLFLSDELPEHGGTPSPKTTGNTTIAIHAYVENCDKTIQLMKELGATVTMEPADMFWGERFARAIDPFGHVWGIATLKTEMEPAEIEEAARRMLAELD